MKKVVKIVAWIAGILAIIDVTDMIAKGQAYSSVRTWNEDVADDILEFMDSNTSKHKLVNLRGKIIAWFAKCFNKIAEILY